MFITIYNKRYIFIKYLWSRLELIESVCLVVLSIANNFLCRNAFFISTNPPFIHLYQSSIVCYCAIFKRIAASCILTQFVHFDQEWVVYRFMFILSIYLYELFKINTIEIHNSCQLHNIGKKFQKSLTNKCWNIKY